MQARMNSCGDLTRNARSERRRPWRRATAAEAHGGPGSAQRRQPAGAAAARGEDGLPGPGPRRRARRGEEAACGEGNIDTASKSSRSMASRMALLSAWCAAFVLYHDACASIHAGEVPRQPLVLVRATNGGGRNSNYKWITPRTATAIFLLLN
ncbi:hypothetical protein SEVIR_1G039851v4 [Setaria viridis]